ncbi:MAG: hypothetical protein GXX79_16955, partial [Actinomycetales bacterium]|nr:hypothetical protein [Actinomycetales bacterium]
MTPLPLPHQFFATLPTREDGEKKSLPRPLTRFDARSTFLGKRLPFPTYRRFPPQRPRAARTRPAADRRPGRTEGAAARTEGTPVISRRTFRTGGVLAAATGIGTVLALFSPISPAHSAVACTVNYTVSQWSGGFVADVRINNLGEAVNGWRLTWSFTAGQQVVSGWNATVSQSGSAVTATSMGYNAALPGGASTGFGFQGTSNGTTNPVPGSFALNGTTCTGGGGGGGG